MYNSLVFLPWTRRRPALHLNSLTSLQIQQAEASNCGGCASKEWKEIFTFGNAVNSEQFGITGEEVHFNRSSSHPETNTIGRIVEIFESRYIRNVTIDGVVEMCER